MVAKLELEYAVEVVWQPFYLRPDTPPEGMDLPDYVVRAQASGAETRLKEMAKMNQLEFVSTKRIVNTRLAHEATAYAREMGHEREFHRTIFQKVYGQGLDISHWDVLREAANEVGLDADDMQQQVLSGKFTTLVANMVQDASQIGVTGVPTYVIDDRYAIVGAQPYEVFKQALERIRKS